MNYDEQRIKTEKEKFAYANYMKYLWINEYKLIIPLTIKKTIIIVTSNILKQTQLYIV